MQNKGLKLFLWFLLLSFLALSYKGWFLRTGIENENHHLFVVADYYDFKKTSDAANVDIIASLDNLQAEGVNYVGVKELSLREMALDGRIALQSFYEFKAFNQVNAPEIWASAQEAIPQDVLIASTNLVVSTAEQGSFTFIQERLLHRFAPEQIISFANNQRYYIIVNSELSYLDRRKDVKQEFDASLGFDPLVLSTLRDRGFEIVLRPENTKGTSTAYFAEYDQAFADYNTKYLIFSNQVSGNPNNTENMSELIKKYNLTVGIIETSEQIKYVEQPGLNPLLKSTSYPINRVYSTGNDEFVKTVDDRFYRWIRGVVDRGIRIVYLTTFKDPKLDASENLDNTIATVGKFNGAIAAKGYSVNTPLPHLTSAATDAKHALFVSLSLLIAALLYLIYLFPIKKRYIIALLTTGALALLYINIVMNMPLLKVYALGGALLYPAFSSLLLLLYIKHSKRGCLIKTIGSLAIVFSVNMLGSYTIITSLNDIRFIMNLEIFSGVKLAFLAPILLFIINYFACFASESGFINTILATARQHPNYGFLFLMLILAAGGYYYLGRSGNNIVEVSSFELRFRELLETFFIARPRFKEFLIGYPAIVTMVYLYHKYKYSFIPGILGIGVIMGSISMVNSFCHVFTAAAISWDRSLLGLAFGTALGFVLIIIIKLLERIIPLFINDKHAG